MYTRAENVKLIENVFLFLSTGWTIVLDFQIINFSSFSWLIPCSTAFLLLLRIYSILSNFGQ